MTTSTMQDDKSRTIQFLMEQMDHVDFRWFEDYAECEHEDTPKRGVVAADWNDEHAARIGKILEHLGFELEWCDEWIECSDCYRAVRTSPTHYGWLPRYSWIGECDIVCEACIREDIEGSGYLEELTNNPRKADCFGLDFSQWGFEQPDCERYESGFHLGQNADPSKVDSELRRELGDDIDVIFQITGAGQFDTTWIVWVRPSNWESEGD